MNDDGNVADDGDNNNDALIADEMLVL